MRARPVLFVLLLTACLMIATAANASDRVFGKGVSANDTILVSELLDNADQYVGETVRVEGTVVGCCKKRGQRGTKMGFLTKRLVRVSGWLKRTKQSGTPRTQSSLSSRR